MGKLEFKHFIKDRQGIIFASARDRTNKVYNFLINTQTGRVLKQISSRFEQVMGEDAEDVKSAVERYSKIIPTYNIQHFDFS